jgi:hypothetical protein
LKVVVEITDLELDGYQLSHHLRMGMVIQVELAGENHILALFSPVNSEETGIP